MTQIENPLDQLSVSDLNMIRMFVDRAADLSVAIFAFDSYRGKDPMTRDTLDATLGKALEAHHAAKRRLITRLSTTSPRSGESVVNRLDDSARTYEIVRLNTRCESRILPTRRFLEVSSKLLESMEATAIAMLVMVP